MEVELEGVVDGIAVEDVELTGLDVVVDTKVGDKKDEEVELLACVVDEITDDVVELTALVVDDTEDEVVELTALVVEELKLEVVELIVDDEVVFTTGGAHTLSLATLGS